MFLLNKMIIIWESLNNHQNIVIIFNYIINRNYITKKLSISNINYVDIILWIQLLL